MRSRLAFLVAVLVATIGIPAHAAEFAACWVTVDIHPIFGTETHITRCRIVGGGTVDYASDTEVPAVLYPTLGTDITGQCWYLTSASTPYVILNRYADGSVDIGLDVDPASPGGIIAIGPTLPRCTSEPAPVTDPSADAWDYVMSYIHDPPVPDLNPPTGEGITGLATFVGVAVPAPHSATLTSGASSLEVEIDVDAVIVDWGDDTTDAFPPSAGILAGYPNGAASHVYEVKDHDGFDLVVSFDWTARWRLAGGAWTPLAVPNTTTSVLYPVAEIVSRLGS